MTERTSRKAENKRAWAEMRQAEANARAAWASQAAEVEALQEHADRLRAEVYAKRAGPPAPGPTRTRWYDILYALHHDAPPDDGHEWTQFDDAPRTWYRDAVGDERLA